MTPVVPGGEKCYIVAMTTITIPKRLISKDLILISRDEYEAMKRVPSERAFKTVRQTPAQKRELEAARRDYARGDFVTLDVLRKDLERRGSR